MRLVLGLAFPTSGEIKLFGNTDLSKERARIGSLIEAPGLFKNCSAYESPLAICKLTLLTTFLLPYVLVKSFVSKMYSIIAPY